MLSRFTDESPPKPTGSNSLQSSEEVKAEQAATLEALAQHHGLRNVLAKGLTNPELPGLASRLKELQQAEDQQ